MPATDKSRALLRTTLSSLKVKTDPKDPLDAPVLSLARQFELSEGLLATKEAEEERTRDSETKGDVASVSVSQQSNRVSDKAEV